jgi:hypothetical protein
MDPRTGFPFATPESRCGPRLRCGFHLPNRVTTKRRFTKSPVPDTLRFEQPTAESNQPPEHERHQTK